MNRMEAYSCPIFKAKVGSFGHARNCFRLKYHLCVAQNTIHRTFFGSWILATGSGVRYVKMLEWE